MLNITRHLSFKCWSTRYLNISKQNWNVKSQFQLRNISNSKILRENENSSKSSDSGSTVLVYEGRMTNQVIRVKIFSISTSIMGLVAQPILYEKASSLPVLIAVSGIAGFFTFVTPVLLYYVTKRYVKSVEYNKTEDVYTINLLTFLGRRRPVQCKPGEGVVPDLPSMFTNLEVNGVPMLIDPSLFAGNHFQRILGYDKPLDIKHESLIEDIKKAQKKTDVQ